MPVRFLSPSLGGSDGPLPAGRWELNVAYRHLGADQWIVGTDVRESAAPFGQPVLLNIDSFDVSASYGLSERVTLTLTVPFSRGTHSRVYADGVRHTVEAAGLGDISLGATVWLRKPSEHPDGNFAVGFGLKAPSGNNNVVDDFFLANGSTTQSAVDQSIQLGDGGLGVILQAQGFHKLFGRASGYFNAWYLMTPRERTGVPSPLAGVPLSVPDVYSMRPGFAYALAPKQGLSATVGTRMDGIPVRDFVGGSAGFRRPGYSLYADPGIAIARRHGVFTINVPLRVHQNFKRSVADIQQGTPGGGDLARYLILAGYSVRF